VVLEVRIAMANPTFHTHAHSSVYPWLYPHDA
jgi:hypothetical protein